MRKVEFLIRFPYVRICPLTHNLLQGRELCKVFRNHIARVTPLKSPLFLLCYSCSMPPLSGSSFLPFLFHLNENCKCSMKIDKQKSFQHDIIKLVSFLGINIQFLLAISLTRVDLLGILIINYKNYKNINPLKVIKR
jgi:hypothetical protein